ncbi:hypothetical protein J7I94_15570 [Streptomyces sp. ISL-12]|uniref:hypothetical protein n=1 Tax=Streptomyces sp. ISL-12 TaxID=2819177 RepID=UPI001BEA0374|nr:hypothetical protein [Streptomyces sp. ISL-12]MBT2411972.1 hypothetical protein [Streptomyces sp. ISL-12]
MSRKKPPAHNSVHIGGDAHGPVVAGDGNRVDVRTPEPTAQPAGPAMHNTADQGATVYAVMNGNQYLDRPAPEED